MVSELVSCHPGAPASMVLGRAPHSGKSLALARFTLHPGALRPSRHELRPAKHNVRVECRRLPLEQIKNRAHAVALELGQSLPTPLPFKTR